MEEKVFWRGEAIFYFEGVKKYLADVKKRGGVQKTWGGDQKIYRVIKKSGGAECHRNGGWVKKKNLGGGQKMLFVGGEGRKYFFSLK